MSDKAVLVAKNLNHIYKDLNQTKLIAVTKYSPVDEIVMAYLAGHKDFGENKVQDLKEKSHQMIELGFQDVHWHFIGHLQTNKVKDLLKIPNLVAIHSIDSIKLLEELLKRKVELDHTVEIFLQVNTSDEEEKSGFDSIEDLITATKMLENDSKYHLTGLMTIGKIRTENFEVDARNCFQKLISIKDEVESKTNLKKLKLSMGMSQDYKIAIEMGSDFVRIGSLIFNQSF